MFVCMVYWLKPWTISYQITFILTLHSNIIYNLSQISHNVINNGVCLHNIHVLCKHLTWSVNSLVKYGVTMALWNIGIVSQKRWLHFRVQGHRKKSRPYIHFSFRNQVGAFRNKMVFFTSLMRMIHLDMWEYYSFFQLLLADFDCQSYILQ